LCFIKETSRTNSGFAFFRHESQRRKLSAALKAKVAIEALKDRKSVSELAAGSEIHPTQVSAVKPEFLKRSVSVFEGEMKNHPAHRRA
jgi:transposase-like protein